MKILNGIFTAIAIIAISIAIGVAISSVGQNTPSTVELHQQNAQTMVCPNCGESNVKLAGKIRLKWIYQCEDCEYFWDKK